MPSSKYDYSFFDLDGTPITMTEWVKLSTKPWQLDEMVGDCRILTIWTGVDSPIYDAKKGRINKNDKPHNPALPFVSYAWNADQVILYSKRYPNIEEAKKGHSGLTAKLTKENAKKITV
jgi:hypothetical protein